MQLHVYSVQEQKYVYQNNLQQPKSEVFLNTES